MAQQIEAGPVASQVGPRFSLTSDFRGQPPLQEVFRETADAGFDGTHFCHQWNTDYEYAPAEIDEIGRNLRDFGLQMVDLHASQGKENYVWSLDRDVQRAGLKLVINRIMMVDRVAELSRTEGPRSIVLHMPQEPQDPTLQGPYWGRVMKAMDALQPYSRQHRVRVALENMYRDTVNPGAEGRNFPAIKRLLLEYDGEFLGVCYDSGHGNVEVDGLDQLEGAAAQRLIALHLHDNPGRISGDPDVDDKHMLPFTGTVDWSRLAGILATSTYKGPITLESSNTVAKKQGMDVQTFLRESRERAQIIYDMVEAKRGK